MPFHNQARYQSINWLQWSNVANDVPRNITTTLNLMEESTAHGLLAWCRFSRFHVIYNSLIKKHLQEWLDNQTRLGVLEWGAPSCGVRGSLGGAEKTTHDEEWRGVSPQPPATPTWDKSHTVSSSLFSHFLNGYIIPILWVNEMVCSENYLWEDDSVRAQLPGPELPTESLSCLPPPSLPAPVESTVN